MLGDVVIRHIKTVGDHNGFDQRGGVLGQAFVGHQQHRQVESFGCAENYFLDHAGAGIGIDPYPACRLRIVSFGHGEVHLS